MLVALVALVALLLAVDIGGRVIDGWRLAHELEPATPEAVAHRVELTGPNGRAFALQTDQPLSAEAMARLKDQFERECVDDDPLAELVKHRYVVTLPDDSNFGGVLVDTGVITTPAGRLELVFMFDQCNTLPKSEGDTPETIAGRVILWSSGIAYLQQVS